MAYRSAAVRFLVAWRMVAILAALVVISSILTEGRFSQIENLTNVLRQVSFEGLIAFGMTFVIVTGGIDLSVGSLVALTGVAAALAMEAFPEAAPGARISLGLLCGVAMGAGSGAISGLIIARFAIPPFIVTLAAMLVARGFAFILCDGQPVYELPDSLIWWGRGFLLEPLLGRLLPTPVLAMR